MEETSNINNELTEKLMADEAPTTTTNLLHDSTPNQGEARQGFAVGAHQEPLCRDGIFAILWYAQIVIVLTIALTWGRSALKLNEDYKDISIAGNYDDAHLIFIISLFAALGASVISSVCLGVMWQFSTYLVQLSLVFSSVNALIVAILSFWAGSVVGGMCGLLFFALSVCYAFMVWRRIPFAAANLGTAIHAIKSNYGVMLVAFLIVGVAVIWTSTWTMAFIGVYTKTANCAMDMDNGSIVCQSDPNSFCIFLLLVSYFWTHQVLKNTVHATVAGTVGTWWFDPIDASSFCSKAVGDSFYRSTTYSFGSICFGSLLVAIIQALRQIVNQARQDNNGESNGILLCIAECILMCLESLIEYFNKWAFIYVGLYGYDYITAGKSVMALFRERGWTTIITDDLVSNTLGLVSLIIGLLTGGLGVLVQMVFYSSSSLSSDFGGDGVFLSFGIAFLIGIVIASIVMSVIDSGVNTVLVCFAEDPAKLQSNHPRDSEKMLEGWRLVYPEQCGF